MAQKMKAAANPSDLPHTDASAITVKLEESLQREQRFNREYNASIHRENTARRKFEALVEKEEALRKSVGHYSEIAALETMHFRGLLKPLVCGPEMKGTLGLMSSDCGMTNRL